ncbi:MAG: hypothetical protein KC776_26975 [Myxococcales bacterium]|nr:hypothetical protein [Myxococcales bacterium]MCB9575407.1 hypothetical protein [Polyangiaceae bacterium]
MTWESRRAQGETPWDTGAPPPALETLLRAQVLPSIEHWYPGRPWPRPHCSRGFERARRITGALDCSVCLIMGADSHFELDAPFAVVWAVRAPAAQRR